jgi:Trp operon repressor
MPTPKQNLFALLTRASHLSPSTLDQLLTDLLTPREYEDLVERVAICQLLAAGHTVKEISEHLGVASATIVRGNRVLKHGTGTLARLLGELR